MNDRMITEKRIREYKAYLIREEKSQATCEKYVRDVCNLEEFIDGKPVTKELLCAWKKHLLDNGYGVRSINSILASANSFLNFIRLMATDGSGSG